MTPTSKVKVFKPIIAGLLVSAATPAMAANTQYTVEVLEQCPEYTFAADEFIIFDGRTNLLKGWSHADERFEYQFLSQPADSYTIDGANLQPNKNCYGENTFDAVLLKKLGSWSRNHSAGIEPHFERAKITFGDIHAIVLELKIDSQKSVLPSQALLHETFAFAADPIAINGIDTQQYNFGITLFESGFSDQSTPTLNSQTRITLNPLAHSDKWLRVTLPLSEMRSYLEKDYAPAEVQLNAYAKHVIHGLRINPESQSGKVVRNLNPQAWEDAANPKELFKEMAISLRKVALIIK